MSSPIPRKAVHAKAMPPSTPASFSVAARKVALVAIDWLADKKLSVRTQWGSGFNPLFKKIAETCDANGCDMIVYALWSHNVKHGPELTKKDLFGRSKWIKTVILEVARKGDSVVEVWNASARHPHRFRQSFARSGDSLTKKRVFMEELPARILGDTMILACGEMNIINTRRGSSKVVDNFSFLPALRTASPSLIVNPLHDCMIRPEMKRKRRDHVKPRTLGDLGVEPREQKRN